MQFKHNIYLNEVTLVFYLIHFTLAGPWKCTGTYISLQIPAHLLPRAFFIIKALVHQNGIHMTGASTTPKKLTLKKTWLAWLIVWKYNHIFLFLIWPQLGVFFALSGPFWRCFWSWSQVQKLFLGPTYVNNQLWFWKYSPNFLS